MKKIEVVEDPEFERRYPEHYSCSVTVFLDDGKELTAVIDDPKGDKRNPMTFDDVVTKFYNLVSPVKIEKEIADRIISGVAKDLDDLKNVADLIKLINVTYK